MPEQLLAPEPADPAHDGQEPKAGSGEAIDMTALRALRRSRADVEALDLTADRLRRLQDEFAKVVDDSRLRADRVRADAARAGQDDVGAVRPVRPDGQQAHHPQEPGPHRGWEASH